MTLTLIFLNQSETVMSGVLQIFRDTKCLVLLTVAFQYNVIDRRTRNNSIYFCILTTFSSCYYLFIFIYITRLISFILEY